MPLLKVLSYNIQDLPAPFRRSRHYYTTIAERLSSRIQKGTAPDIVLLQEAFTSNSDEIVQKSGYSYFLRGPKSHVRPINSGLMILSCFPISPVGAFVFRKGMIWDLMTSKGVMAINVDLPGISKPICVLNTHLQAFLRYDAIRRKQVNEICDFLSKIDFENRCCIFAGDFNSAPGVDLSFDDFTARTRFVNVAQWVKSNPGHCRVEIDAAIPLRGLLPRNTNEPYLSMDHHFFYVPKLSQTTIHPIYLTRNFTEFQEGHFLSDHFGYEVHYEIS